MSRDLEPIGSDLESLLARMGMPPTVDLSRLVDKWEELAGEPFASMAVPAGLADGELLVEAVDGRAASLLKYRVGTLLDRLQEQLGEGIVRSIRIRVGNPKKGV